MSLLRQEEVHALAQRSSSSSEEGSMARWVLGIFAVISHGNCVGFFGEMVGFHGSSWDFMGIHEMFIGIFGIHGILWN